MYTTLLDKDGKVVDTNDPHRAIDRRYKSVEQGGKVLASQRATT